MKEKTILHLCANMESILEKTIQIPNLEVQPFKNNSTVLKFKALIKHSGIKKFSPKLEIWTSNASNKTLAYHSHGIFRYFGKFPPPIARHLIQTYTNENDLIVDPMCGSGTTALEALLLNRRAKCFDVNPLSILISKVKVTRLGKINYLKTLERVIGIYNSDVHVRDFELKGLRNPHHWFLAETIHSLSKIKYAIDMSAKSKDCKDALSLAFLSIVRRASRATTQQGRLFLDADTAIKDTLPLFTKKAHELIKHLHQLPISDKLITIENRSILNTPNSNGCKSRLIICHPPYFNSYKFSGVNSLELAWMGIDHALIRQDEVRESFKVGKPEKIFDYLFDMEKGLRNLSSYLEPNGRIALMIGDTMMKGKYIPVTKNLLSNLSDIFEIENSALRIPKFTEASWAASQRRTGIAVGINLCDLVVVLKKR